MNREAVEKTINEFREREGCEIDIVYAGCGTLVGKMQTGDQGLPDLFMTCDASYLDMVQQKMGNPFGPDMRLSSTRIIMLVAKGNPHGIESLEHLAKRGLRVGTDRSPGEYAWRDESSTRSVRPGSSTRSSPTS